MGEHNKVVEYVKELRAMKQKVPIEKLISGEEIMSVIGIGAGPRVGRIKSEIEDKILVGDIKNREEALNYLNAVKEGKVMVKDMAVDFVKSVKSMMGINLLDTEPIEPMEKGKWNLAMKKAYELDGDEWGAMKCQFEVDRVERLIEKGYDEDDNDIRDFTIYTNEELKDLVGGVVV
jgi:hypothetical protein